MRKLYLAFCVLCLAMLFAVAVPANAQANTDATVKGFEERAQAQFKAAGLPYDCKVALLKSEPDGPGRIIGLLCKSSPYVCVFLVLPAPGEVGGVVSKALECRRNLAVPDPAKETEI